MNWSSFFLETRNWVHWESNEIHHDKNIELFVANVNNIRKMSDSIE